MHRPFDYSSFINGRCPACNRRRLMQITRVDCRRHGLLSPCPCVDPRQTSLQLGHIQCVNRHPIFWRDAYSPLPGRSLLRVGVEFARPDGSKLNRGVNDWCVINRIEHPHRNENKILTESPPYIYFQQYNL